MSEEKSLPARCPGCGSCRCTTPGSDNCDEARWKRADDE